MFPDIEVLLADLLAQFVTSPDHTGTYTDADLGALLPFIAVRRYGGPDDWLTDQAAVDVDYLAATRAQAINLARAGHAFLIAGPHSVNGVLVDSVRTDVGITERPRVNGSIRRFGGSYTVSARRIQA